MDSSRVQDGVTGLVFEKGDVEALANILSGLIAQPELRTGLGKRARVYVEGERTWASMGTRINTWLSERP